jgi:hypothetical protein
MRHVLALIFFCTFLWTASGQKLPTQWIQSDENHMLTAGSQPSVGLYDETVVEELRLYFSQPNYWNLLTQNYATKVDIPCKLKYKNMELDSVGIRFKGQTSYFMNQSEKKSFNVSIDTYKDQKLVGYKTLNLNNAFQDASFMREVLYYQLIRKHTPSAKANFVRLYINDKDWGLYLNVQQLNKDFLEEWYASNDGINMRADQPSGSGVIGPSGGGGPNWGDGTAAINYLGTDTALYKKYYTLKSNDLDVNPWEELAKVCNVLNNSGVNLESEAPKVLDIDKILWHLACEIAFVDDDSYVYKGKMDYYLYMDAETKRWATYDYDGNSAIATNRVTWSPFYNANKPNYPLLNKLLAVPAYRQRYLAHLRTIIHESFDETKVNTIIDNYNILVKDIVFADTKKTTSNSAYTSGLNSLKNFIRDRKAYLLNDTEVKQESPVISDVKYSVNDQDWAVIHVSDQVVVSAIPSHSSGIRDMVLHYCPGFSGVFQTLKMTENASGKYQVSIPPYEAGTMVRFYVEAIANNASATRTYFPKGTEHQVMIYEVKASVATAKTVVINEFMASNTGIIKDEADETEDWIELYNNTDNDIDLSGYFLTDKADDLEKWTFPAGTVIKAKGYLVIWADEDQEQGSLHSNFKLSASGEEILLLDKQKVILDNVVFGQQVTNKSTARIPNGIGNFVIGDHTFGKNNEGTNSAVDVEDQNLILYPNPAEGFFNIKNPYDQEISLTIYDVHGRIFYTGSVAADDILTVEMEVPGTYFVKYGHTVKKVVVIK